jgi:hypothetical protein
MKRPFIRRIACGLGTLALVLAAVPSHAEDSIEAARTLYSAAAYEEALAVLERLATDGETPQRMAVDQYRAFCLLALGRTSEAERAMEAVVSAEPLFRPSDTEASPRVRSAFASVRQRMLPIIIQRKYAEAKTAFDQKNYETAVVGFDQVLAGLADPSLSGPSASALSDLRTLATGFRELSVRAVPPPPPPPPVVAEAPVAAVAPALPALPRTFGAGDVKVAPPRVLRQELPRFTTPPGPLVGRKGVLEVLIDQTGSVETATMRTPIDPRYDRQVLAAAKGWKYKPASFDGQPVRYRKLIVINVTG